MIVLRGVLTAAAALFGLGLSLSAANAQGGVAPQIAVPDNAGSRACYGINGPLYGPYSMSFCIGSSSLANVYRVVGSNGLDCLGSLTWNQDGRGRFRINLGRTSCNRGWAWSADRMTCSSNIAFDFLGLIFGQRRGAGQIAPQIAVPDVPVSARTLRCLYMPAGEGAGTPPTTVVARYMGGG